MNTEFEQKMKRICEKAVKHITNVFQNDAIEAHVFGSMATGTNDALSDIDIWITFDDSAIASAIENRMNYYSQIGEILLNHEMQNNFPLDGIQSAVLYKIDVEIVRVDYYLCPLSSSRIVPNSKILFEKVKVLEGNMIPETKRTPRDLSDRISFFICMCFNGVKKVVRKDEKFIDFLTTEFGKYEKEIPELVNVPKEATFDALYVALDVLAKVSNPEQLNAINEIRLFTKKVENIYG